MSNELSSKGKKAERKISTEKHRKKDICEDDFLPSTYSNILYVV